MNSNLFISYLIFSSLICFAATRSAFSTRMVWCLPPSFSNRLDDQQLVVRYGELRDGIHRTHVAFPLRHQHLVVAAHRVDHPFLNGGALRHFLVHDLEPDKVRLESYVRPVPRFRVEIEQPVVRVDGFQEELHPEAFAAQVPDLPACPLCRCSA